MINETCQFETNTLSNSSMISQDSLTQIVAILIASMVGIGSMAYSIFNRYYPTFTLHFVGIRRPSNVSKSQYNLLKSVDTESTMTSIETSLRAHSKVSDLKKLVKKIFDIPDKNDVFISYHNILLSKYQNASNQCLADFGITNNSLLTLAICDGDKAEEENHEFPGYSTEIYEERFAAMTKPVRSVNQLFANNDSDDDDSDDEEDHVQFEHVPVVDKTVIPKKFLEPFIGFDVIMQTPSYVYRMPQCGHEMSRDSLYEYAVKTFENEKVTTLPCPHRSGPAKCKAVWPLAAVLDVLRFQPRHIPTSQKSDDQNVEMDPPKDFVDLMKLELMTARNTIQNGSNDVQKCPRCKTLYLKSKQNALKLDDIKTAKDVELHFKFECVLCKPEMPPIAPKTEQEIEMERAHQINEMFGMFQEDEDDEDDVDVVDQEPVDIDPEELARANAINQALGMFGDEDDDDDDDERKYKDEKEEKTASFCFCCGDTFRKNHVCGSFKDDLVNILQKADTKKIGSVSGVPSIRCCPKCCQLLFHIDCCKHMRCRNCDNNFCMVCLKSKENGKWQCGGSSDVCPVAPRQSARSLPDNVVISKQQFKLFDDIQS